MKVVLAQLNYHIGHFEANASKMIESINSAKASGAELIVFSDLLITPTAKPATNTKHFL